MTREDATVAAILAYAEELSCPFPTPAARLIAARIPQVTFNDRKALVACIFLLAYDAKRRGKPVTRARALAVMNVLFPADVH
jgi:hypothetical protein